MLAWNVVMEEYSFKVASSQEEVGRERETDYEREEHEARQPPTNTTNG